MIRRRLGLLVTIAFVSTGSACTSGGSGLALGDAGDAGGEGLDAGSCTTDCEADAAPEPLDASKDDAPAGSALNPYGVPYPTDNIGWKPRAGSTRGDRIANVTLQGYRPSSSTLGTVSLADLYDPQRKTHDVVFIVCTGSWEQFGKATLESIHGSTKRIATLAVLGEGTSPGKAATLADLASFRAIYPWATTGLDASFKVFGAAFDASALPFVMVIDARTMEIAQSGVGGLTSVSAVDDAVNAVTSRPPAY